MNICNPPYFAKAGGAAGTAVDLLFFPIDTVKTRLQSAQGFVKAGGFNGIYKGIGSVVVGSAPGGEYCLLVGRLFMTGEQRRCSSRHTKCRSNLYLCTGN